MSHQQQQKKQHEQQEQHRRGDKRKRDDADVSRAEAAAATETAATDNDGPGASAVMRSVLRGSDGLSGRSGELQVAEFVRQLQRLSWRRLGQLLVLLCESLEQSGSVGGEEAALEPLDVGGGRSSQRRTQRTVRCATALSCTVQHMACSEDIGGAGRVDSKCVRRAFGTLMAAAWRQGAGSGLAHQAAKAAAMCVGSGRFDREAVVQGVARDGEAAGAVLGAAMDGRSAAYAVRVLRCGVARRLAQQTEGEAEHCVLRVLGAVARRALTDDALGAEAAACAGELLALVHVRQASAAADGALDAVSQMSVHLADHVQDTPQADGWGRRWTAMCRGGGWALRGARYSGARHVRAICGRAAAVSGRAAWRWLQQMPDALDARALGVALELVARVLRCDGGREAGGAQAFALVGRLLGSGRSTADGGGWVAACLRVLGQVGGHATMHPAEALRPRPFVWAGEGACDGAVAAHVFAQLDPAQREEQVDEQQMQAEEQEDEDARVLAAEHTVAGVFCALDAAAYGEDTGGVVEACVRWLGLLLRGEGSERRTQPGVRAVGQKARVRSAPSDWATVQRVGELRRDAGRPSAETSPPEDPTYAAAALRALRFLTALSVLHALSCDIEATLHVLRQGCTCSAAEVHGALQAAQRADGRVALDGARVVAGVLGVQGYLVERLRMPHAYARRAQGRSCAALQREAAGALGGVLVQPALLRRACDILDAAAAGECSVAGVLVGVEVAGCVARHGVLRAGIGDQRFFAWWGVALAAVAQRLRGRLGVLAAGVLLSSVAGVPLDDASVRALSSLPRVPTVLGGWCVAQLAAFEHPVRAPSVLHVVCSLAALPWSAEAGLSGALDMEARRRARDVCAVAKDALALLRRLLAHATPWLDFGALRMDARVGALLARLVAGRLPPVISAVVEQAHKEKEEEAGGGGSARQMCVRASEPRSALLVDRLLHVAGQPHASPHTDPNRLYAAPVLAALWQEYCAAGCLLAAQLVEQSLARAADDGALAKALHVAGSMRPRASVQESLAASSMLPFRVLLPMALGSGDPGRVLLHRAGPLWDALAAAFPPAEVAGALGRAATLRACLLAALLLPPVDHTKRAQPLAAVLRSVAGVLVRGASQHATSALCSSVLRFLACRQHAAVHRSLARCVVALDASAVRALREFSQSLTAQQLQQQKHAGLLDDSVGLSARGGLVHVSRALLVAASPVFGVMLDGGFAESSAVRADVPVELDCAHDGLAALVDVLQRLVALLSHTHEQTDDQISAALRALGSELDCLYATPVRAALLELAVYYDVRPVAAFALCMALWDVEQAHCVPEIVAVLADLVAEDWSAVFGLQEDAEALVHRAVCAVVFLHDGVDLTALDESAVDLIADSTGGLFDMSSNLL